MSVSDITVSVRECMLYYFKLAAGERSNWSLENEQREPLEQWVKIIEKNPNNALKTFPTTTYMPQQAHRIPSGTIQLPQHPRKPGQGQKEPDSTATKRSEYSDVGELLEYGKFYKFTVDGQLKMKYQDQWVVDQNDKTILYHDSDKLFGHFQGATATPEVLQGTSGKGKAKVDSHGPPTSISSSTSNTKGDRHSQSQFGRVSSDTLPKSAAPKYTYIGRLPTGWKSYRHKEGNLFIDLPKSQWREVKGYYYHDGKMLQGKAP